MTNQFQEPPINSLEDTHPTQTVPLVSFDEQGNIVRPVPLWRRLVGLGSLLGAFGLTVATVLVLMTSSGSSGDPTPPAQVTIPTQAVAAVATQTLEVLPTFTPETDTLAQDTSAQPEIFPTLDPETANALLAQPISNLNTGGAYYTQVQRQPFDPFTTIPDRPRNEIITYEAVRGDTINSIAERFGLQPNTIAWSNNRRIVHALYPGDLINIPPVDGVLIDAIGGTRTVADYAALYKVDDPFIVLDSPYNGTTLAGLSVDSVPPSGTPIFIPGGEAESISWTPAVIREEGGGAGGTQGNFISFAPGEAGSCGRVANPGGGAYWTRPVSGYTITQGFSGYHSGIDLSVAVGTPVMAANGGRVIFAGWNSFGYGNTIVLAHGPYTTLYGHLNDYNVGCGQDVAPGQIIGYSGNSGNSSGPHLHFEIRYNDIPTNPASTIGF